MTDITNPRLAIGRINISGVDPVTARQIGTAIENALGKAVREQGISLESRRSIRLTLGPDATANGIATAVAKAIGPR
ncbi:MAG: hypothetical protein M3Q19_06315 [Pseudomonadota bacterium]|nr:hypothetical protein [Pseudomonadota bacterium]